MTPTTAIQRAEQWRKENACGEAAKVAIALLNELQALQASRAIPDGHVVVPKEPTIEMIAALGFGGDVAMAIGYAAISEEIAGYYRDALSASPAPEGEG